MPCAGFETDPALTLSSALVLSASVSLAITFLATAVSSLVVAVSSTATGAMFTLVLAVAVLLAGVLSLGEETVALLVMDPPAIGAVTVIVMAGAAPGARFPPVRLHVTVPDALAQFQFVPVALTNDVPAGRVSTTLTAEASFGPAFDTPRV